ncbi:VOC family protein [Leucobacter salsicius]|uniref:VOC family protein n=1 Tax=Leucobacter salsicius TaxID=664638 RepID=UPI00034B254D|nr:VOC family protein [Leucobacter salsicius]
MIGELYGVVLDCPDPATLAEFYRSLLGGRIQTDVEWVDLVLASGVIISFQSCPGYVPPRWPGTDGDQQAHLDVRVADLAAADPTVRAAGGRFLEAHDGFYVYLDPVGHPFCTVL